MINKIFNITLIVIVVCISSSFSQTQSVLNRFGIGNIEYTYSARKAGMGELGISIEDKDFISIVNPASWNLLSSSRFEFGTIFNGLYVKDNSESRFYSKGYFSGFAFGIPVYSALGITAAFGIIPYSTVGYETKTIVPSSGSGSVVIPQYTLINKGEGGLSKLFFGTSYRFNGIASIGTSFEYYFGNINYRRELDFGGAGTNSKFSKTYKTKGLGMTLGVISTDLSRNLISIDKISELKLGASLAFTGHLNTDSTLVSNSNLFADTNSFGSGKIAVPLRISAGMSFVYDDKFLFTLDFLHQNWGEFNIDEIPDPNMGSVSRLSLGTEYRVAADGGNWDRVIYRGGLSFGSSPFKVNNNQLSEIGVYAGASFALARENYVDLGIQYLSRGNVTDTFIQENLIKVTLGMSLGELWFVREER